MSGDSKFVVETGGRSVLSITFHKDISNGATGMHPAEPGAGGGDEQRPWQMASETGSLIVADKGLERLDMRLNELLKDRANLSQRSPKEQHVSASSHSQLGSREDCASCRQRCDYDPRSATTAAGTDEIETHGLLDDLDGLYDMDDGLTGDLGCKYPCKTNSATTGMAAATRSTSVARTNRVDMDVCISSSALTPSTADASSGDQLQADVLGDMSDAEAMQIIGALGGFVAKRPGGRAFAPSTGSATPVPVSSGGSESNSKACTDELRDMEDDEARTIIKQFGGFSKSLANLTTSIVPRRAAVPATPTTPTALTHTPTRRSLQPPISTIPALLDTPGLPAEPPTDQPAGVAAAQSPLGKFPSRRDVLSARRALKADSGRPPAPSSSALNSPLKTIGRSALLKKTGLKQMPSVDTASAKSAVGHSPGPARQLVFKSPSLKRPLGRPQFNTPSKRALSNGNQNACLEPERDASTLQSARLAQSPQPPRLPTKAAVADAAAAGAGSASPYRVRIPVKLPPVTNRLAGTQLESAKHVESQVFDLAGPTVRYKLSSMASQIGVGGGIEPLPPAARTMSADGAAEYRFPVGPPDQFWGPSEAKQAMLARGCRSSYITDAWVLNHFRWIVWSCACYARRFPAQWHNFWSIESITNRLLYRYEREYARGQQPALKRILECDSSSQQLIVLCVASIHRTDKATLAEVTDGWYSVHATLDSVLAEAASRDRLRVGDKIACVGLRMGGLADGVSPLTDMANCATLLLNANCVQRAPWDAKLGFQHRKAMYLSLSAVLELGGPIGAALDVVVMRCYPMLYMETLPGGQRVVRTEREEQRISGTMAEKRATMVQDLKERRLMAHPEHTRACLGAPNLRACQEGKELYDYVMHHSSDPAVAQQQLSGAQAATLDRYAAERQTEIETDIAEAVARDAPLRQVRAFFRLLVCDYPAHRYKHSEPKTDRLALVTVWGPRALVPADFAEGSRFLFTGLTVSPRRARTQTHSQPEEACLRLNFNSTGSHSKALPADPAVVQRSEFRERGTLCIDELCHVKAGEEVDLAGCVAECRAGQPGQSSVLHLSTNDEHGKSYSATVEFPVVTFGAISVASGCQVTVRNCLYASCTGAAQNSFHLRASDGTELVI